MLIEISDQLIQFLILEDFIKESSRPTLNKFKRDNSNFNDKRNINLLSKNNNQINDQLLIANKIIFLLLVLSLKIKSLTPIIVIRIIS